MAEKTEKATPKKLRDARKKGQVAKSQDFPSAFTFIISIAATLAMAKTIYEQLAAYMVGAFRQATSAPDVETRAGEFITQSLTIIFNTSFPVMLLTSLAGVLVGFLTVGPLFSMEIMKPDIKKLNPVENLKNMFKFKTLFELLKSILKIIGACIIIYSVVYNSLPEIIATAALPVWGSAQVFSDFLLKVIIRVGIFFIAVAILDLVYQRRHFANEMKMEKFEVKQEFRDTEGDPQIRSKRKQTAQEIAYQEGPAATRRAKAVITNPTHLAIALEYDAETQPAPRILTMGQGLVAEQIIKIAVESNIPVMRNIPLAHTLYQKGKISEYVPEETYEAIAEILKWLESLEVSGEAHPGLFDA